MDSCGAIADGQEMSSDWPCAVNSQLRTGKDRGEAHTTVSCVLKIMLVLRLVSVEDIARWGVWLGWHIC